MRLLVFFLFFIPALAVDFADYKQPAKDRSPIQIEKVELSASEREELSLLLIGIARNHCYESLDIDQSARLLAIANEIDPHLTILRESWALLPSGPASKIHAASNLEEALSTLSSMAENLQQHASQEESSQLALWLIDIHARCQAALENQEFTASETSPNWNLFFPENS